MSRRRMAGPAILLLVVIILCVLFIDHPVARFAASTSPSVLAIFRFITWFGQGGVVLWPSGLIVLAALLLKPRLSSLAEPLRRVMLGALLLFIAVALAGLANDAIKIIAGRARPHLWLQGDISGFHVWRFGSDYASFPSGHTATSVAAAIAAGALFPRWRPAFWAFAVLIAVSRIVLDAHYVSDVIGGATVGAICAVAVLNRFRSRNWLAEH